MNRVKSNIVISVMAVVIIIVSIVAGTIFFNQSKADGTSRFRDLSYDQMVPVMKQLAKDYANKFYKSVISDVELTVGQIIPIYNTQKEVCGFSVAYMSGEIPYGYVNIDYSSEVLVTDYLVEKNAKSMYASLVDNLSKNEAYKNVSAEGCEAKLVTLGSIDYAIPANKVDDKGNKTPVFYYNEATYSEEQLKALATEIASIGVVVAPPVEEVKEEPKKEEPKKEEPKKEEPKKEEPKKEEPNEDKKEEVKEEVKEEGKEETKDEGKEEVKEGVKEEPKKEEPKKEEKKEPIKEPEPEPEPVVEEPGLTGMAKNFADWFKILQKTDGLVDVGPYGENETIFTFSRGVVGVVKKKGLIKKYSTEKSFLSRSEIVEATGKYTSGLGALATVCKQENILLNDDIGATFNLLWDVSVNPKQIVKGPKASNGKSYYTSNISDNRYIKHIGKYGRTYGVEVGGRFSSQADTGQIKLALDQQEAVIVSLVGVGGEEGKAVNVVGYAEIVLDTVNRNVYLLIADDANNKMPRYVSLHNSYLKEAGVTEIKVKEVKEEAEDKETDKDDNEKEDESKVNTNNNDDEIEEDDEQEDEDREIDD